MIPVQPQPEPKSFEEKVKKPGYAFLKKFPSPTAQQLHRKAFWRESLKDLRNSYNDICAYSAIRCFRDATVDHFVALHILREKNPKLAYDWGNFRLATRSMNSNKREFQDVVDPFTLQPESFILVFPSMEIKEGPKLPPLQAQKTIRRLKLNEEEYINQRIEWVRDYSQEEISFRYLQRNAPFIAYELERQGLIIKIKELL